MFVFGAAGTNLRNGTVSGYEPSRTEPVYSLVSRGVSNNGRLTTTWAGTNAEIAIGLIFEEDDFHFMPR